MDIEAAVYAITLVAYIVAAVISLIAGERFFCHVAKLYWRHWYAKYAIALADGWLYGLAIFIPLKLMMLGKDFAAFNATCAFFAFFLSASVARLIRYRLGGKYPFTTLNRIERPLFHAPGLLGGIALCALSRPA